VGPPVRFCAESRRKAVSYTLVILEKKVAGLNDEALGRFVLRARKAVGLRGQVNVLVTSSASVRSLNLRFRRQNKATDVLSFPSTSSTSKSGEAAKLAGEVAISADIALKNSFQFGHPPAEEIKVLALHGILHLAGFDHERDNGEMARKEAKLRRELGLPTALTERVTHHRTHPAHRPSTNPRSTVQAKTPRRTA
jgi:probable rRNA maturation factor